MTSNGVNPLRPSFFSLVGYRPCPEPLLLEAMPDPLVLVEVALRLEGLVTDTQAAKDVAREVAAAVVGMLGPLVLLEVTLLLERLAADV